MPSSLFRRQPPQLSPQEMGVGFHPVIRGMISCLVASQAKIPSGPPTFSGCDAWQVIPSIMNPGSLASARTTKREDTESKVFVNAFLRRN
ncbi:hypothetical protein MUK42_37766 [Musa troglodytarum]|uniref:Uncharacterized protein n=1 Tax=Musa troglodytarum TaxID=320322 RepID=A0A9E7F1J6_9LILI|nr:hypothetical protein MUK42_37766 [Musa troglodytarum]